MGSQGTESGTPHSLIAVANALIARGVKARRPLSQQALHKLVYLVDGYHWAAHGRPGVDREAKAWEFGPHYPLLIARLEYQGNRPIRHMLDDADEATGEEFEVAPATGAEIEAILDFVSATYGAYSGPQLSDLTAKDGGAWQRTRLSRPGVKLPGIPGEEVGRDYAHLVKRKEEPEAA